MKSNTRFNKNTKGIECLNCKQPISNRDNFCSNCGQVNDNKPLSIKQYITELLGGFFAFDTRTLNTLKPLLLKPGKVTSDYINGERMKYVNPFQLYLHTSIIFFLVTSVFMGIDAYNTMLNTSKNGAIDNVITGWNAYEPKKDSLNLPIDKQIIKHAEALIAKPVFLKTLENKNLSENQKNTFIHALLNTEIKKLHSQYIETKPLKDDEFYEFDNFKKNYISHFKKVLIKKKVDFKLNVEKSNEIETSSKWLKKYMRFYNAKTKNVRKALDSLGYKPTDRNVFFYKKMRDFKKVTKGGEAGDSFVSTMISKSSLVLFFMLPLFSLFLKLLYIRQKYNYTEHLIFVFNTQTIFFILLLTGIIFDRMLDTDLGSLSAIVIFSFYLYKAMLKFYKQKRLKTFVKFILLNFLFFILSVFGIFLVAFLAFLN